MSAAPREALIAYHERSKHRLDRYAPGPGRLDWANQPDPFRVFVGAARLQLPFVADTLATRYNDVRTGVLPPSSPFELASVATLFELSLGLSAWKSFGGTRWALRCNPSSGNLHPTEGYLVCASLPGIPGGVHHYVSRDHMLEQRAIAEPFGAHGVLVGLSSIHWREAWKYGMRAWRYCAHDCGHAIAAISYAAAALGWQARLLHAPSDDMVEEVLGLARIADFEGVEREAADALIWIGDPDSRPDLEGTLAVLRAARWSGRANRLSEAHVGWREIDAVHAATRKVATDEPVAALPREWPAPAVPSADLAFERIARQRRSAVDFDGLTRIGAAQFFAMLDCLLPRRATPPWNALATPTRIHAALLVHRVDGLEPGLYVLARDAESLPRLRQSMRPEWIWEKVGPAHLPLYLLLPHDLRAAAKLICCHQDIAADSCFALGMLAPFEEVLEAPWQYRELYWECGMLGHVLYLEAEAAGIRATGIGCFFDDEMHELLGIADRSWQSLYHFTAGGPVDDARHPRPRPGSAPPGGSDPDPYCIVPVVNVRPASEKFAPSVPTPPYKEAERAQCVKLRVGRLPAAEGGDAVVGTGCSCMNRLMTCISRNGFEKKT